MDENFEAEAIEDQASEISEDSELTPRTRYEYFLNKIADSVSGASEETDSDPVVPRTRVEYFLNKIAEAFTKVVASHEGPGETYEE